MPELCEFTYAELRAAQDKPGFLRSADRVRQLHKKGTRFVGLRGQSVWFQTYSSEYTKNKRVYEEEIKLLDLPESLQMTDLSLKDRVLRAMRGDVAIRCTCPAFSFWGFAYVVTGLDAGAEGWIDYAIDRKTNTVNKVPEFRFPGIRNPSLYNVMCKHLMLVMEVFAGHWNSVLSALKQRGFR